MKQSIDIREELINIAPTLVDLPSTNPFVVPDNYFESLTANVMNKVTRQVHIATSQDDHENLDALVDNMKDDHSTHATNPFAVPDNYFKSLPDVVMERVKSEPKIIIMPPSRLKNWMSMAAAIAAVVLVSLPMLKRENIHVQPSTSTTPINEVSSAELYNYLTEDISVLHVEDVAAGIPDAWIDTIGYKLFAANISSYDEAAFDISQIDIESLWQ